MLLDRLRAQTGRLTITLTVSGEDLPKIPDGLSAAVSGLMSMAEDWIVAEDALDRDQQLDLLSRLPDPEDLATSLPANHGLWMAVSVGADPLIVPLSPGVPVSEQVVVDDRVALLRPLLEHEQRPRELLVLTLSEQQTRLAALDLTSQVFEPVGAPFPVIGEGGQADLRDRSHTWELRERRRHPWRRVAQAAHRIIESRDLPVVTVGTERNQALLREVAAWSGEPAVAVIADPDLVQEHELVDRVVVAAEEYRQRHVEQIVNLLDARRGRGQITTGLTNLFAAAITGRIDTLVLVDGPRVEGFRTPSGRLVTEDPGDGEHLADVHALVVAEVVRRGGRVLLAVEDLLDTSTAILRW